MKINTNRIFPQAVLILMLSAVVFIVIMDNIKFTSVEGQKDVGTLVSIEVSETSFGESAKSQVTTSEGVFTIKNSISGILGKPVSLTKYKYNKHWYLRVGNGKPREVLGY